MRKNTLAAPWAGEDQQRPFSRGDGVALGLVQPGEQVNLPIGI
ncbi:MAG TPA: hypothetical protein VGF38_00925 [Ktedonobacterales bacterium]